MENKRFEKTRKVSGIVLSSVILTATLIGAGFGFANSAQNNGGADTNYNDFVQIEADVDYKGDYDIKDAANSISQTLEFLGMQNAEVRTMGDSKVIINNPIETYRYDEFNIMNNEEDHMDLMSATANSNYFTEVSTLVIPLFFDGTLDIRDLDGEAAFAEVDNNGSTTWQFVGGVEDGGTFGVEAETGTDETSISTSRNADVDFYIPNFFEEAHLKHSNGYPVIEMEIAKKGSNSDEYINMFKELDAYIDKTENSANPTQYVVWFNYDWTYNVVNEIDPDGLSESGSLYSYVSTNPNLRPLYVTTNTTSLMSSIYSDTIELTGTFSEQQAQYFVNRINNSNRFEFSNVNLEVIINLQTKIMLIVLASILLVLILVVIFSFVAYFGLLGMIASAIFTLVSVVTFSIVASSGILITGIGLVSMGIIITLSGLMIFSALNIYKNDNEDKFKSVNTVGKEKLGKIHSILFVPIVSSVLIFYVSGLILGTLIAIPLYLVVIGLVVSYLFVSVLLIPSLFVMDALIEWTRFEYTKKWDFFIGFNPELKSKDGNGINNGDDVKKKSMIGTIVATLMLLLSVIVGGTLYGTTGSAFNSTNYGTENYSYIVQVANDSVWLEITEDEELTQGIYGADAIPEYYKETKTVTNDVEKAFEDNGVKVSSIDVIRVDKVEAGSMNEANKLLSSFGFEIYSKDSINVDMAKNIQTELDAIAPIELSKGSTTFELTERMSWDGRTSTKMIGYTDNSMFLTGVYALLAMIAILALVLLVVGNWGVALASVITTIMEVALIISPLVLLYIPISNIVIFPIILLAGMSFVVKTLITKQAKADEIETNKWERATARNKFAMPIFSAVLLVFELLLFGIYSWIAVVPMLIVTIIAPFSIYLIQQSVFPYLAVKFDSMKVNATKNKLERDIEDSKNPKDGQPREEYIEGVNM